MKIVYLTNIIPFEEECEIEMITTGIRDKSVMKKSKLLA
jgi:hypothetical protein